MRRACPAHDASTAILLTQGRERTTSEQLVWPEPAQALEPDWNVSWSREPRHGMQRLLFRIEVKMSKRLRAALLTPMLAACIVACAPTVASPTSQTTLPTRLSTATVAESTPTQLRPTVPAEVQRIGEIALLSLPGIGNGPQALAVLKGRIYVANRGSRNVAVIEGHKVTAVIPVDQAPVAISADQTTGRVYVAHETENSISVISDMRVVKTFPAPKSPACLLALDGRLYVGARGENNLVVLDGASGARTATLPLKASIGVLSLAVSPVTHLLYAGVYDAVEIVDIQKLQVIGRLEHDVYATLATDPSSERFFLSEYEPTANMQYLVAYDALGTKQLGRVQIGGDPRGVAIDPRTNRIYVANSWTNNVSVIDGKTLRLTATILVGLQPMDVAISQEGEAFVANSGSDNLAVLGGATPGLMRVIALNPRPMGMAVHPGTGRVYVACAGTNRVGVLEADRLVSDVPVGLHPSEVVLSSNGETLYALNYVEGSLSIVSTGGDQAPKTLTVGRLPRGLALSPETRQLYVGDQVLDEQAWSLLRHTQLETFYRSNVEPIYTLVDSPIGRAFIMASNGVPGSNGGLVVYVVDLKSGKRVEAQVGGLSMTAMALDMEEQRIFSTAGRFGSYSLIVDDAKALKHIAALALDGYPVALGYNPNTHHIFICLTFSSGGTSQAEPGLLVLDSRGLGTVASISLPGAPGYDESYALAVDAERGWVYLSDTHRGSVHVLRDVALAVPPTPVPTATPTPWPTLTPQPEPSPTVLSQKEPSCTPAVAARFYSDWTNDDHLRLALQCPTQELRSGFVAEQPFERGEMLWREADRTIFVLFNDGQWRSFADHWQEGMAEHACAVAAPGELLLPKRGFGLIWCDEKGVKEGLGWATAEESGSTVEWQAFEGGEMLASAQQGALYALFADGSFVTRPMQ